MISNFCYILSQTKNFLYSCGSRLYECGTFLGRLVRKLLHLEGTPAKTNTVGVILIKQANKPEQTPDSELIRELIPAAKPELTSAEEPTSTVKVAPGAASILTPVAEQESTSIIKLTPIPKLESTLKKKIKKVTLQENWEIPSRAKDLVNSFLSKIGGASKLQYSNEEYIYDEKIVLNEYSKKMALVIREEIWDKRRKGGSKLNETIIITPKFFSKYHRNRLVNEESPCKYRYSVIISPPVIFLTTICKPPSFTFEDLPENIRNITKKLLEEIKHQWQDAGKLQAQTMLWTDSPKEFLDFESAITVLQIELKKMNDKRAVHVTCEGIFHKLAGWRYIFTAIRRLSTTIFSSLSIPKQEDLLFEQADKFLSEEINKKDRRRRPIQFKNSITTISDVTIMKDFLQNLEKRLKERGYSIIGTSFEFQKSHPFTRKPYYNFTIKIRNPL